MYHNTLWEYIAFIFNYYLLRGYINYYGELSIITGNYYLLRGFDSYYSRYYLLHIYFVVTLYMYSVAVTSLLSNFYHSYLRIVLFSGYISYEHSISILYYVRKLMGIYCPYIQLLLITEIYQLLKRVINYYGELLLIMGIRFLLR